MQEEFNPYYKWLGIPPEYQPPNHYQLLGLRAFEDDPDVIANAADQRMSHVRTFQTGKHGPLSQKLLNEIAGARVVLLNPQKKTAYDSQLAEQHATTAPPTAELAAPPVEPAFSPGASFRPSGAKPYRRRRTIAGPLFFCVLIVAAGFGAVALIIQWKGKDSAKKSVVPEQPTTEIASKQNDSPTIDKTEARPVPTGTEPDRPAPGTAQGPTARLAYSAQVGGGGGEVFREIAGNGRPVVGFDVTTGMSMGYHVLTSIAPVYDGDTSLLGPQEIVWVDDEFPTAKEVKEDRGDSLWGSRAEQPVFSGDKSLRRKVSGIGQMSFSGADDPLAVAPGDQWFVHVHLDPEDPPKSLMVQFLCNGRWDQRAYWGEDLFPWGVTETGGRRRIADLPSGGRWVRRTVDPAAVGLSPGTVVTGLSFSQVDGTVYWDKSGLQRAAAYKDQPRGAARFVARPGYAVGGLLARRGQLVDAIRILFMRNRGELLDTSDFYLSPWIGGDFGTGPTLLGGDGRQVAGVFGRKARAIDALGVALRESPNSSAPPKPVDLIDLLRTSGANEVYLADIPRRDLDRWMGIPFTRLNGRELEHSIPLAPRGSGDLTGKVVYEVNGKYQRLQGAAGISEMGNVRRSNFPVLFRIEGDGRELWASKPLQAAGETEPFDIDVSGVQQLRLTTRVDGDNAHWAHALFVEPKLLISAPSRQVARTDTNADLIGVDKNYVPEGRGGRFADLLNDDQAIRQGHEKRLPIPSVEERAKAKKRVDNVYGDEIAAAKKPEEKLAVASKLFQQAGQTTPEEAERYVLLDTALSLATDIGEWRGILDAVNEMAKWYEVPHLEMKDDALSKAADIDRPDLANDAVRMLNDLLSESIRADEYDIAKRFARLAGRIRRKANHAYHLQALSDHLDRLDHLSDAYSQVPDALKTLEATPDDPEANLVVGRYFAVWKGNWRRGLPHLAKGSDEQLQSLAKLELQPGRDPAAEVRIGHAWVALAEKTRDTQLKDIYENRAMAWFKRAQPNLTGINLAEVEKAIEDLEGRHGLKAEYFVGPDLKQKVVDRVDPMINFDWRALLPDPKIPRGAFSARWTGYIAAPAAGTYTIVVDHDDGVRIAVDGRVLLDKWNSRGRDEAVINFGRTPRAIRIEYKNIGGPSHCRLSWAQKDGFGEEFIPAEALFPDKIAAQQALAGR